MLYCLAVTGALYSAAMKKKAAFITIKQFQSEAASAMLMSKKLNPGQPGTKRLVSQYGARLVCVRYRYDGVQGKRFKTVELILEEAVWQPPVRAFQEDELIAVRVELAEVDWRQRVKRAGGKWNPARKLWELPFGQVRKLGLTERIQSPEVSANGKLAERGQVPKVSDNGKK
ncbi:MAG: hypothetical protein JNM09_01820 [Blastocatellia bacterium]|nr:hypothetical protein [Blastocatellia bacterium]